MKWISEADELPPIAQSVFYAHPRMSGDFWDISVARILVQYEGVAPRPVKAGHRWPTAYWWSDGSTTLITGNGWWAKMDDIPLPPGAEHRHARGQHYVAQPVPVFIPQSK